MSSTFGITTAVTSRLLETLVGRGRAQGSRSASEISFSSADQVRLTLDAGSRAFAKAFSNINTAVSFINLSLDALETLDTIVGRVVNLSERAARGGGGGLATVSSEYRKLARQFEQVVKKSGEGSLKLLSKDDIKAVLLQVGLDSDQVDELSALFAKFLIPKSGNSLADDTARAAGVVKVQSSNSPLAESLERVSLKTGTTVQGSAGSGAAVSVSADGEVVVFSSAASNLVTGDTNGVTDLFVRNVASSATERISVSSAGVQGNGASASAADEAEIAARGRYVAFSSVASNLVTDDLNGVQDIFVRDLATDTTERISVSSTGVEGNGASEALSISADGRYVVFGSDASNLVADDTNGVRDVFLRDRQLGTTTRVSLGEGGVQGNGASARPALSDDGRYISFESDATNLVAGDTNAARDVFVYDGVSGSVERVSLASDGTQATAPGAGTGGSAGLGGGADAGGTGPTEIGGTGGSEAAGDGLSAGVGGGEIGGGSGGVPASSAATSRSARISADGRYVVFLSEAANLVVGDTNGVDDIFLRDRTLGTTTRASVSSAAVQSDAAASGPRISADGSKITFISTATNLIAGDSNGVADLFQYDRTTGSTVRMSESGSGQQGNGATSAGTLSSTGRYTVFSSDASNLVSADSNSAQDVFLLDDEYELEERAARRFERVFGGGRDLRGRSDAQVLAADAKQLRKNLRRNIELLRGVRGTVGDTLEAVRATALAMIDAQQESGVLSVRDAETLAERLTGLIATRSGAAVQRQAGSLDAVLAVALLGDKEKSAT